MFSSFGVWNIGHGSPLFTHSDLTVQIPQSLGQKRSHDVTFGAVFWSLDGEGPRIHLQIIHKGYRHSKARCMPFRSCDMCSNIPILWTSSFSPADLSSCSGSAKVAVHAEPTISVNYHVRSNGTVPCGVSWLAMKPGPFCLWKINETVDGWKPANKLIGSLSEYSQGFIHPRWCRISSINRRTEMMKIYSPCRKTMDGRPPKRQYISGV